MCLPLVKGPKVMGQNNNHKSNFHFLILGCKSFAVNYSLKSGTHRHRIQVRWLTWPLHNSPLHQRVFEGKEVDCYAMAKSITWPESDWACISLAEDKTEGKCPKNKQELKTVAVEAWQSITRDETQRLVMSMRSRLQAVIDCKDFATSIKSESLIYDYYSVPLLLVP